MKIGISLAVIEFGLTHLLLLNKIGIYISHLQFG
ncbi:hypothetical protein SVI_0913 [Shewanella violacea DSS12]|uniref:Uncharacterized protein n=1 Tax=Shewanella violacea (strain JCM 10179 / CIP 106290 / LMG 19151 / DSS12) TaxID=637905 RepID=D4ZGT5_SHEVD|nr:hypothetical protein SVI_0913 [Shewanella violacea DSS12]